MSDMAVSNEMAALSQERSQLFKDVNRGIKPKRVPIASGVDISYGIQYCGHDLKKSQWDLAALRGIYNKCAQDFNTDRLPVTMIRFPLFYKTLGARNFMMGADGFLQHPEIDAMQADEYDELVKDPYKFILETILPRIYTELDTNPIQRSLTFAKSFKIFFDCWMQTGMISGQVCAENGLDTSPAIGGITVAPFDFVADMLRGFSGIAKDIRRCPEKTGEAAEAVLPMMLKLGIGPEPSIDSRTFIPLHMAPYIRMNTFEKYYWPSFKKLVDGLAEAGMGVDICFEQDWMRYLDFIKELPEGITCRFEYGDAKTIKDKLGTKYIISGLYPINLLKHGTKEECIDKAKELVDILGPGGGYIFDYDKNPLTLSDANPENIIAVNQFVKEYGVY